MPRRFGARSVQCCDEPVGGFVVPGATIEPSPHALGLGSVVLVATGLTLAEDATSATELLLALLLTSAGLDRRDAQVREGLIDVVRVHELQLRRARVSYSYRVFDPKLQLKITL